MPRVQHATPLNDFTCPFLVSHSSGALAQRACTEGTTLSSHACFIYAGGMVSRPLFGIQPYPDIMHNYLCLQNVLV